MKIKSIKMKNFKSIGGKIVEIQIPETGLLLIHGANGNGKTTIFSAINYALFGKNSDVKGESKTSISASELINDINKKEMMVELTLDSGYIIRRGLSPDVFEIIDPSGINVADKSSKVIDQQWLEQELLNGMSYAMFHKLVYISAKSISTPFLYLTGAQRKEFIEHILDIRILYYINEVIKKRSNELKLDIKTISDKMSFASSSIIAEQRNIETLKQRRDEQAQQIESLKQNKQTIIETSEQKIVEMQRSRSSLDTDQQMLEADVDLFNRDISILKSQIKSGLESEKHAIEMQISETKSQMLMRKNQKDVHEKNLQGFVECGTCSTLKSIVGEFDYDGYTEFINQSKTRITQALTNVQRLNSEIEYNDSVKQNLIVKTNDLKDIEFRLQSTIRDIESYDSSIRKEQQIIQSMQSQLDTIKPIEIDETYLDDLNHQYSDLSTAYDALIAKQDQFEGIKKRVSDKSIKRELMEYYIPVFEQKINDLLSIFMEDDPFTFTIKLTEDFEIEGFKNGRKTNIFKFSEGQKASMNMAFLMSIQYLLQLKNSQSFGLLAVDEVLDAAIDNSRLDKIVQHLVEISKDKPVMVISHNKSIQSEYFDQMIRVEREHGFTTYQVESH